MLVPLKLNQELTFDCGTHHPSGFSTTPDSTPTWYIFEGENDTPIATGTFTARTGHPNLYKASTFASGTLGFEVGKVYHVWASGTVAGLSARHKLYDFVLDTKRNSDLQDISVSDIWANGTRTLTNLDSGTIASGIWNSLLSNHLSSGSMGSGIQIITDVVNLLSSRLTSTRATNLDNLDTTVSSRSTAANVWTNGTRSLTEPVSVSGTINVDTSAVASAVWNFASRTLTSGSWSTLTLSQVVNGVWDELIAGHTTNGSFGSGISSILNERLTISRASLLDNLDTTVSSRSTNTGVWNNTTRSLTEAVSVSGSPTVNVDLSSIPSAVWSFGTRTLTSGNLTITQIASGVWVYVDRTLTSVPSGATASEVWNYTTRSLNIPVSVSGSPLVTVDSSTISAAVWGYASRTLTSGINNLTVADIADGVWDELINGHTSNGSFGSGINILTNRLTHQRATNLDNLDSLISSRATNSGVWENITRTLTQSITIDQAAVASGVWNANRSNHTSVGTFGSGVNVVTNLDKDNYNLSTSHDIYFADIDLRKDSSRDEYTVSWFKNGSPVTNTITTPYINVVKRTDGSNLIAPTAITQIGSFSVYKHDETTNIMASGEAYIVITSGIIDGSNRVWRRLLGRDSV